MCRRGGGVGCHVGSALRLGQWLIIVIVDQYLKVIPKCLLMCVRDVPYTFSHFSTGYDPYVL